LFRGSEDGLIKDEEVKAYERALSKSGQRVEYIQVGGANHAFFDWKPDTKTQATFNKYGKYHAHEMLLFFDSVLENLNKTNN
jgi:alpha/beta hydrolase fold-3 domain protein